MKKKTLAIAAAITVTATILIAATAVVAEQSKAKPFNVLAGSFARGFANVDPVERLNNQKEVLQKRVEEGKPTQEEADKRYAEMEKRNKEIQDFNSMSKREICAYMYNITASCCAKLIDKGITTME